MHATVNLTETGVVSGTDTDEPLLEKYEILVLFKTRVEVDSVFAKLSEGGINISKFKPHPPPDDTGGGAYVTDKYGWLYVVFMRVTRNKMKDAYTDSRLFLPHCSAHSNQEW